jgi:signal transduction histidine kinase
LRLPAEEFLKSLHLIVGLEQLLENFTAKLREMLDAQTVYVVLYEPITDRYVGYTAKGEGSRCLRDLNFSRSDNLIKWLNVNRCPLKVTTEIDVLNYFSPSVRELLRKTRTVLIVPLIVMNRLTGAVFITNKRNGKEFFEEEIAWLSRLADQSALAIEHALMYQFQEDKLKRIFHAEKLATVGELAAGAAHEIRNPLTSIRSSVQYLQKDMPPEKKPLADAILEEVDRIDRTIRGLLSFSKTSELQIKIVNLQEIIEQTLTLLDAELRKHAIDVHKQLDLTSPMIPADASQLKQVFLNILLNSIQAMPEGGTITLTARDERADFIQVLIRDTGTGISARELPKVFDPFFTTKENGTGLGLSISYGIVSKHGGDIEIASNTQGPATGTTVVIRLPRKWKQARDEGRGA